MARQTTSQCASVIYYLWRNSELIHSKSVLYRVYNESVETASTRSFNENDVSGGRVNVLRVPLPHTGASLKIYLSKVEGVTNRHTQLFEDEGGNSTLEDNDSIALLSGACPGILEDAPLAFVHREIIAPEPKFPRELKALFARGGLQDQRVFSFINLFKIGEKPIRRGTRRRLGRFSRRTESQRFKGILEPHGVRFCAYLIWCNFTLNHPGYNCNDPVSSSGKLVCKFFSP
jgi:hypothetical protein